ncbi:MAG: hypothetical protein ACREP8_00270 [Candidatus Binatia bacterium]
MSPPIEFNPNLNGIYDETEGVCRMEAPPAAEPVCVASTLPAVDEYADMSVSRLYHEAFGPARASASPPTLWSVNPATLNPVGALATLTGCGSDPDQPVNPGDPIAFLERLGGEQTLNGQPIRGNLNGVDLSATGVASVVAWSVFDSTNPAETGTFALIRSGESGGSAALLDPDTSALHLGTSTAVLENGEVVVAYVKATGEGEPSSIVARRYSGSGAALGAEITVLSSAVRTELPGVRLIPLGQGFLAVYRDGIGRLSAQAFAADGRSQGTVDVWTDEGLSQGLGRFAVSRGAGDEWCVAMFSGNGIQVRAFSGLNPGAADTRVEAAELSPEPDLAVAMQPDGSMMLAWNTLNQGIRGAILNAGGSVAHGGPFAIRDSGLANTLSLAGDHRGNYLFSWEEAGQINARIYNGTPSFATFPELSTISSGFANFDVQSAISEDGVMSLVYARSQNVSGETLIDLWRRDYRIVYQ